MIGFRNVIVDDFLRHEFYMKLNGLNYSFGLINNITPKNQIKIVRHYKMGLRETIVFLEAQSILLDPFNGMENNNLRQS